MREVLETYLKNPNITLLAKELEDPRVKILLNSCVGSCFAFVVASLDILLKNRTHLLIAESMQEAAYLANDLEELLQDEKEDYTKKHILFYPSLSTKQKGVKEENSDNSILRLQVLNRLSKGEKLIVVAYPESIEEKVVEPTSLRTKEIRLQKGENLDLEKLIADLDDYGFEYTDFVVEGGQYALRGGIIDIFSFAYTEPYRIELNGDRIESIRTFDIATQISIEEKDSFLILPDLEHDEKKKISLFSYFDKDSIVWAKNLTVALESCSKKYESLQMQKNYLTRDEVIESISSFAMVETGLAFQKSHTLSLDFYTDMQPSFNQDFSLFADKLEELSLQGYDNVFFVRDDKQKQRIQNIITEYKNKEKILRVRYFDFSISAGFIDNDNKKSYLTDHQLFNRYNRYRIKNNVDKKESLTIDELINLKPGDYVTHMDYGVGKFSGLEKLNNNGKIQEAIRLIYKNNDILYVSIHSLHKISRYTSSDGIEPKLNKLGSSAWQTLKEKTKKKVKDIAKDLIKLYAQRKASKGFAFSSDSYLQNELEASFIYEDTPDQYKAVKAVKKDMELSYPMDRLICGDVGFGKTEVAVRAAFKAVNDSKQVAVLVPTTILAFQHYKTFSERLKNMPCHVDYLNRFRSSKEKTQILKDLKNGRIDIIIGTHAIVSKNIEFKDLGLLIIDEEQKFGVSVKEKIKQMKVNVDTLTLTATPIPRTLQFSLMGARDLSVINTAPPNRQPITTQIVNGLDQDILRKAIVNELNRGGQVFFVHNRIQNLENIRTLLNKLVPQARIAIGHGQMEGKVLEQIMMDFINEQYDILLSTTIVENGLDIPNANTIIINDAQNYGLSDLHQLRGRVGRSNKKAYCYLVVPSENILTQQAYKRLQAISEFSSIGSGFALSMRDLDIRGAGNILGAEQSGFISDIGYDTYNKILQEAMEELKENDYAYLYQQEKRDFVKDCLVETDMEVLIPDNYISNVTERFKIYKELDSMNEEEDLQRLERELRDRFGKIPQQTLDLFDIVRIRKMAKLLAVENLKLKKEKAQLIFVRNKNSEFYSSEKFQRIILFANQFPTRCLLKEENQSLILIVKDIKSVGQAKKMFEYLLK
ncbi:MAG: transcription-repair coupling factor [Bacteroidota bacterium]|nr:transcription-repair coupling factor [Bacteroidota bacterium]